MSDSLSNKELVAVGHQFAKAMSSDTPIIDMAKIVSHLAERLDCTTLALREAIKQRDALAAENAGLKAAPNMLLPAIDDLDENQLRHVIKTCTENYSLLHSKWEAAEKRIAEMKELLQWSHDTLLEINPSNYTHDDVCEANAAAVEVILGIAPTLGETHGKANEWWESRAAGIRINGEG